MTALAVPFPVALLAGGLVAAAFGFVLGLPALRPEGPYPAIATMAFGLAVIQVIGRSPVFGATGKANCQAPRISARNSTSERGPCSSIACRRMEASA